ncbi:MAG: FAD-dependent oxidoreductase [Phycisphaerae bacterium]|nr:FAD-dependent oxidoreductase [Phycisphaerae bacterium]
MKTVLKIMCVVLMFVAGLPAGSRAADVRSYDVVIVGGTPGGIMTAVAVGRGGHTAVLLDRDEHVGGLPANGLGATDIHTRGATAGLFTEFVGRIRKYYVDAYGPDSAQVKDCSDGYHFEPSVAEKVFEHMLAEVGDKVAVLRRRQFDALPENVTLDGSRVVQIAVTHRDTGKTERYRGTVFVDATYEGDLAAAAGCEYRIGREGQSEFDEPMAGRLYKAWAGAVGPGSTGLADNAVQAYNFRLCLTKDKSNMTPIPKPANYNRDEFVSLIDDVNRNRGTHDSGSLDGIPTTNRLVNTVKLPNAKTDANNQHWAFISTDLPEENWPWPTAGWDWRDRYAQRLRDYTLGLWWFSQYDGDLPESFRSEQLQWGLAADEYTDNSNFPRQVYVREGRRIVGEYFFTAHDALSKRGSPEHAASITASHYALDSHAVRKREPGRLHLDGFFSYRTQPYSVPYGVIVPKKIDGLLIPVPVSGTHIGFSTLRMEPCWMALGQAAGVAACVAIESSVPVRNVNIVDVQKKLLKQNAVLIYFQDAKPGDAHYEALQMLALRGFYKPDERQAKLNDPVASDLAARWIKAANTTVKWTPARTTRGQLLDLIYEKVARMSNEDIAKIWIEW